jgi:exodeoxyribonuclease-3
MKVLSYNIAEGGAGRLREIAAVIARQRPDAVALIEANSHANAAELAERLGMALAFGEANCDYHLAWLSRTPIRSVTNHRHPGLAKTLLEIDVGGDDGPLHLFAAHLASRHEPMEPAEEIPIILDLLNAVGARPHLLVGDFNALRAGDPIGTPPPSVVPRGEAVTGAPRPAFGQLLAAGYVDCYRHCHPRAAGYTYPAAAPWLRLDYLFANPTLAARLERCDRVVSATAVRASDHLPVWATFRSAARG